MSARRAVTWLLALCPFLLVLAAVSPAEAMTTPGLSEATTTPTSGLHISSAINIGSTAVDDVSGIQSAVKAANGDLVVVYNTLNGDSGTGGDLLVIRSTDDGATWTSPQVIFTPQGYGADTEVLCGGLTVLPNGTILLPCNEGDQVNPYYPASTLYVLRSTDNGVTWTGQDDPVAVTADRLESWNTNAPAVELSNGTILLPIWGETALSTNPVENPSRWSDGVIRSTDDGLTWSHYSTVADDPNVEPPEPDYNGGANEFALHVEKSGQVVAMIRYASGEGVEGQVYRSISDDGGLTWSPPQATGFYGETLWLDSAPCSRYLPGNEEVLLMAHREVQNGTTRTGRSELAISYDEGVTWQNLFYLQGTDPSDDDSNQPSIVDLSPTKRLIVFAVGTRIEADVVEDSSTARECQDQYNSAHAEARANPTVFVQRADRNEWAWPLALRAFQFSSTTTVGDVINSIAPSLDCQEPSGDGRLALASRPHSYLDPDETLQQAGVTDGATLQYDVSNPPTPYRIGFLLLDAYPDARPMVNWDYACPTAPIALDVEGTSLGIDANIPYGQQVSSISLRNSSASSRVQQSDFQIWESSDNQTYTEVTGWSYASQVVNGHQVVTFGGLNIQERYIKISQDFTDQNYTFVLADPQSDVHVIYANR